MYISTSNYTFKYKYWRQTHLFDQRHPMQSESASLHPLRILQSNGTQIQRRKQPDRPARLCWCPSDAWKRLSLSGFCGPITPEQNVFHGFFYKATKSLHHSKNPFFWCWKIRLQWTLKNYLITISLTCHDYITTHTHTHTRLIAHDSPPGSVLKRGQSLGAWVRSGVLRRAHSEQHSGRHLHEWVYTGPRVYTGLGFTLGQT